MNKSGLRPTSYYILVRPKDVEEKTPGGLILPEDVAEKDKFAEMKGLLVAIGPMAFVFDDWPDGGIKPQVGDNILFAKYSAGSARVTGPDGEEYWLIKDQTVLAIFEDKA